jgi:hypothetical protein
VEKEWYYDVDVLIHHSSFPYKLAS